MCTETFSCCYIFPKLFSALKKYVGKIYFVWMGFMGNIYHLKFFNLNVDTNFESSIPCNPLVKRVDSWQH